MREFLIGLFGLSLSMSAVIVFVLAFSKRIKRSFSAFCSYCIWLAVIIRLCIPFGGVLVPSVIEIPVYEGAVSSQNIDIGADNAETPETVAPETAPKETAAADKPPVIMAPETLPPPCVTSPSDGAETVAPETVPSPVPSVTDIATDKPIATAPITPEAPSPEKETAGAVAEEKKETDKGFSVSSMVPALFFLWLSVAVVFILTDLIKYNVFSLRLKRTLRSADEATLTIYAVLCAETGIRKAPALYISSQSQSPLLLGFFKKRIVIPDMVLSDSELRAVLSHELTHHRRSDVWTKLISRVARAIHWFNPLVYLAAASLDREGELSCDEATLRNFSEEERVLYSKTMLDIVRRCRGGSCAFTTEFNPKKKAVSERINGILDSKKKGRGIAVICSVCALCIVAGIIIGTSAKKEKKPDAPIPPDASSNILKEESVNAEDDHTLLIASGDDYFVYGTREADRFFGENQKLMLLAGDNKMFFEGTYGLRVATRSKYYSTDITADGVPDHILLLSNETVGEGECGEELYAFDGSTLKEIPRESSFETVSKRIVISASDEQYTVSIDGAETTYPMRNYNSLFNLETPFIDGSYEYYTVDKDGITCNIYCIYDIAHVKSYGVFKTRYLYSEGELILDSTYYEENSKQLYNNYTSCETGNSGWIVVADYDNNMVGLHKGGRSLTVDLPVYVHDKVLYTPTVKPYAVIDKSESVAAVVYIRDRDGNGHGCYEEAATTCIAIIDLESGELLDTATIEKDDILKAHNVSAEKIAPYEYYVSGDHSKISILWDVRETETGVLDIGTLLVTDDKEIKLTGSATYDLESRTLGEYTPGSTVIGSTPVYTADSIDGLDAIEGVEDYKKDCAKAFLQKNTATLETLIGCREGVLRQYEDFEFGNVTFTASEGNLQMNVEITKSSLKTVLPGDYTLIIKNGRWGVADIDGIGAHDYYGENDQCGLASDYTVWWILGFPIYDKNYISTINSSEDYDMLKNDIIKYLHFCRPQISTPEEYKQAAKDIFDLEDLDIPESMIAEDGTVVLWGHGGLVRPNYILSEEESNGIITVKVQTYADFLCTVESHVYEFKYENCGDYLRLLSIDLTEVGEYEPENRYIA